MIPRPDVEIDEEAWRRHPGPILLLAGPGTGKTHQLALRIKDLVGENHRVSPSAITVITFTKEAAENMRRRIADEEKRDVYLPPELRPERIVTTHSLGLEIVRAHRVILGLPEDFQVMTDSRLRRLLFRDAALLHGRSEDEGKRADQLRQQSVNPDAGSAEAAIIEQYERILRANNAIDYDDQILLACKVLEENREARDRYSSAARHLLVDEYQDINAGQHRLINLLVAGHPDGLFVVGDDDQSIYSFRGGTPKYIRDFRRDYGPEAKVLSLVRSRRCPGAILGAALRVVERFDGSRLPKPAPTFQDGRQEAGVVKVHNLPTDDMEAEVVAGIARRSLPKKEVLILVPAKQYAEPIKAALRHRRITYDHHPSLDDSGFALLQTVHRWCEDVADNLSLRLCIEAFCTSGQVDIPSRRSRKATSVAKRQAALLQIASLWAEVMSRKRTLWEALEMGATASGGLFAILRDGLEPIRERDPKDAAEFLSNVAKHLRPWASVPELMKEVSGWLEELRTHGQSGEGGVRVMTLQAAKGLEAEVVCVVGVNEEVIPRSDLGVAALTEAARLTYVSMTRAKEELHLMHSRKRDASITYLVKSYDLQPSRFLKAVDPDLKRSQYYGAPSKKGAGRPTGSGSLSRGFPTRGVR